MIDSDDDIARQQIWVRWCAATAELVTSGLSTLSPETQAMVASHVNGGTGQIQVGVSLDPMIAKVILVGNEGGHVDLFVVGEPDPDAPPPATH